MKLLAITIAVVCATALHAADAPIPPTLMTLSRGNLTLIEAASELQQQSRFVIDAKSLPADVRVPERWQALPAWAALEQLAELGEQRITIHEQGAGIRFAPGRAAVRANVAGPFRVQVRDVLARADAVQGSTTYELGFDVAWEPQLAVFRIDSVPTIRAATDDAGRMVTGRAVSAKSAVRGASHAFEVRLDGLTRESRRIEQLSGEFRVTASASMLKFRWDNWEQLPAAQEQASVKATIRRVRRVGAVWEVELGLEYPKTMPVFESFESWTNRNRLRLVSADRTRVLEPVNSDESVVGHVATLAYRFAADGVDLSSRRGWQLECETPSVLREYAVPFAVRGVRLP